jgi:hypothetical protein
MFEKMQTMMDSSTWNPRSTLKSYGVGRERMQISARPTSPASSPQGLRIRPAGNATTPAEFTIVPIKIFKARFYAIRVFEISLNKSIRMIDLNDTNQYCMRCIVDG